VSGGSLIALLWIAPVFAAEPKTSKSQTSATGVYTIRLIELERGNCRVEVMEETRLAWQLDKCVGTTDDFYFVANNGQRFWIIRAFPEKPAPTKGSPNPWLSVRVAVLYDRGGKALRRVTARELIPVLARHRVRQLGKHFLWLKGVGGVPGEMPRVNDHNEVELEPVESRPVHLKF
jgi:hypothetical protein